MFTGIIEEIGSVRRVAAGSRAGSIEIACRVVVCDARVGDSIAVNGVCLTVTSRSASGFSADVMPETLSRSNLGALRPGDRVNLERAMRADGRFGGHIVSGHIDGVGVVSKIAPDANAVRIGVSAPKAICRLVVEKGSIAIDGVSLTVTDAGASSFEVSVIPHTGEETTLLSKRIGDRVNLECDIIGKYVEKLLFVRSEPDGPGAMPENSAEPQGVTREFLARCGF